MDVQIEAVRSVFGSKKGTNGRSQRLVVASDDEHGDGLTMVAGGSDDEVTKNAAQRRPGRWDVGPGEVVVQRKRQPVGPVGMHWTLDDWNDAARV